MAFLLPRRGRVALAALALVVASLIGSAAAEPREYDFITQDSPFLIVPTGKITVDVVITDKSTKAPITSIPLDYWRQFDQSMTRQIVAKLGIDDAVNTFNTAVTSATAKQKNQQQLDAAINTAFANLEKSWGLLINGTRARFIGTTKLTDLIAECGRNAWQDVKVGLGRGKYDNTVIQTAVTTLDASQALRLSALAGGGGSDLSGGSFIWSRTVVLIEHGQIAIEGSERGEVTFELELPSDIAFKDSEIIQGIFSQAADDYRGRINRVIANRSFDANRPASPTAAAPPSPTTPTPSGSAAPTATAPAADDAARRAAEEALKTELSALIAAFKNDVAAQIAGYFDTKKEVARNYKMTIVRDVAITAIKLTKGSIEVAIAPNPLSIWTLVMDVIGAAKTLKSYFVSLHAERERLLESLNRLSSLPPTATVKEQLQALVAVKDGLEQFEKALAQADNAIDTLFPKLLVALSNLTLLDTSDPAVERFTAQFGIVFDKIAAQNLQLMKDYELYRNGRDLVRAVDASLGRDPDSRIVNWFKDRLSLMARFDKKTILQALGETASYFGSSVFTFGRAVENAREAAEAISTAAMWIANFSDSIDLMSELGEAVNAKRESLKMKP